jgi:hypothetical protein
MRKKALELARCLFELEGESTYNDPHGHWMMNDWFEKYGESSIEHKDFKYPVLDVQHLADVLYRDYMNNFLDHLEYDPYTADIYIGYCVLSFERQLAIKTRVGYQLSIII